VCFDVLLAEVLLAEVLLAEVLLAEVLLAEVLLAEVHIADMQHVTRSDASIVGQIYVSPSGCEQSCNVHCTR
jgi:hypothetical protein